MAALPPDPKEKEPSHKNWKAFIIPPILRPRTPNKRSVLKGAHKPGGRFKTLCSSRFLKVKDKEQKICTKYYTSLYHNFNKLQEVLNPEGSRQTTFTFSLSTLSPPSLGWYLIQNHSFRMICFRKMFGYW